MKSGPIVTDKLALKDFGPGLEKVLTGKGIKIALQP